MRILLVALAIGCVDPVVLEATDPAPDSDVDSDTDVDSDSDSDSDTDTDTDTDTVLPDRWRSALYPQDWTPAHTDPDGRFLHDFSYAGHRYGEPPARPAATVQVVNLPGEDMTATVQAAIDGLPEGGGVVELGEGEFLIRGLLQIRSSSVVLRGLGADRTRLALLRTEGMSNRAHLTLGGALTHRDERLLAVDGKSRDAWVELEDVAGLKVGDDVAIGWVITDDFIDEHGMGSTWKSFNGRWRPFFRRTVRAIEGERVRLDVPLRYAAKTRDAASLRVADGYVSGVGVEDLAVSTKAPWDTAWDITRSHAILIRGAKDAWIRGVESYEHGEVSEAENGERHLLSGGFKILDSKRVSVLDCDLRYAQNRGGGGNGYLYEISRSNEILVSESVAVGGRHNFIQNWDFGTSGCVFHRTTSLEGRAFTSKSVPISQTGYSEFHHSLAMANLIDASVADDGWSAINRQDYSSGAGVSATESVFWNVTGEGRLRSYQSGYGYVIGTGPDLDVQVDFEGIDFFGIREHTEPEDWSEGLGEASDLEPQSLYEDQRKRRLGG